MLAAETVLSPRGASSRGDALRDGRKHLPSFTLQSIMDWRPWVLVGLGGLTILWAVSRGPQWPGGLVAGFLFRVGIIYLVLAAATARFRPISVRRAVGSAIGGLAVAALIGLVTLYYAEVVTEPPVATQESMMELVLEETAVAFLLSPVPAGYVGGVFLRQERPDPCIYLLLGSVLGGWFMAMILSPNGGGVAAALFLVVTLAAGVAGIPPLVLMRRGHAPEVT